MTLVVQLVHGADGVQRLGPQPLQQPAARLLHVLLRHLGERAVLRGRVVGGVHGRAGGRQRGQRGAGRERGQRLRRVVGALGLARGVGGEHGAVSGRGLRRQQEAQVGVERLPGAVVPLVLRDAVDVAEADGAEGAAARSQGAATGGQGAAAAAGRHCQRAGRQAAGAQGYYNQSYLKKQRNVEAQSTST